MNKYVCKIVSVYETTIEVEAEDLGTALDLGVEKYKNCEYDYDANKGVSLTTTCELKEN